MTYTTIISTEALATHLHDPNWVILDSQHDLMNPAHGRDAYAAGHIPGARFISVDDDVSDHAITGRGRHPLPTPPIMSAVFSRLGIDAGKQVVVYDGSSGSSAGRTWWCLRWLGHQAVAILDGGITLWKSEGRPLSTELPSWKPAQFVGQPNQQMKVDTATVLANMRNPDAPMLDARAPERYDGSAETIDPVGGHIPGAINRFWKMNVGADGRFKSAETLRREFSDLLGTVPPSHMIHQCGSGVSACHNLIAMEIAGLAGGKLYPGSWSEWCSDPARPVATGSAP